MQQRHRYKVGDYEGAEAELIAVEVMVQGWRLRGGRQSSLQQRHRYKVGDYEGAEKEVVAAEAQVQG